MKKILFQGDSITDVGRNREDPASLGGGYPAYVAGRLGLEHPNAYRFCNRGISGDRIVDVYARMKMDILNLKPDHLSILVGVNDVWHDYADSPNGVDARKYEKVYTMLVEEVLEAQPGLQILLIAPFMLEGSGTRDDLENFRREVGLRADAVRRIAEKYNLRFLSLQEDLDRLAAKYGAEYWLSDGVHPTIYFHQYMADQWIKAFGF